MSSGGRCPEKIFLSFRMQDVLRFLSLPNSASSVLVGNFVPICILIVCKYREILFARSGNEVIINLRSAYLPYAY